jgi:beta-D-xylosidase 4
VFTTHHYTATAEEAVADVLHAGTDVDCGGFVQQHAAVALAKGLISKEDIDTRLKFLFRMRLRLGHFDPAGPLQQIPKSAICTAETVALARDGTVQGDFND